jgi:hypothetical protein
MDVSSEPPAAPSGLSGAGGGLSSETPTIGTTSTAPLYRKDHADASVLAVSVPVRLFFFLAGLPRPLAIPLPGRWAKLRPSAARGRRSRGAGVTKWSLTTFFFPFTTQTLQRWLLHAPADAQLAWLHQLNVRIDAVLERVPATKVALTGDRESRN